MKLSAKETKYLQSKEAYYEGNPIMEDSEFDILEAELEEEGSIAIEMVGFKTKGVLFSHMTPMKSLDKIQFQLNYTPYNEFIKWLNQNPLDKDFIEASPKFDGNAVNLIYKSGKLFKAITRGDGTEGQDVTDKMRLRVPNNISIDKTLEIRGEVIIKKDIFYKKYGPGTTLNKKNPRNFVAGMLSRDQIEMDILNDLDFAGFEIKMNKNTWMAAPFDHLKHWGFMDVFHKTYYLDQLRTEYMFEKSFNDFSKYRESCEYQLDGFVFKFGNNMRTSKMEKEHHPKWAMAVKFPPKIGRTRIIDVDWNLGTTGVLVPTAILDPVDLDGSTVQRVSMYNYGWALERNLGIGAEIEIVKSGDIIPKIHKILSTHHDFYWPLTWEGNNTRIDDIHLYLENFENLPQFKILKLHQSFISLGMKGIGPAMTGRIFTTGLFETIEDIFDIRFTKENLLATKKFVDGRELEIVLDIVDKVKEIDYWKVINSLKISGNGKSLSKQVANYLSDVDYDFVGLEKAIVDKFTRQEATPELIRLKRFESILSAKGVKIIIPEKIDLSNVGGFYEMTGSPKEHGFKIKAEFLNLAASKGYLQGKLNKDCNFLLTDSMSSSSSKMNKATKLGVEIITYSDFAKKYLN